MKINVLQLQSSILDGCQTCSMFLALLFGWLIFAHHQHKQTVEHIFRQKRKYSSPMRTPNKNFFSELPFKPSYKPLRCIHRWHSSQRSSLIVRRSSAVLSQMLPSRDPPWQPMKGNWRGTGTRGWRMTRGEPCLFFSLVLDQGLNASFHWLISNLESAGLFPAAQGHLWWQKKLAKLLFFFHF